MSNAICHPPERGRLVKTHLKPRFEFMKTHGVWEIALRLTSTERITRRRSVQVLRRPWKKRVQDDLDLGWSSEMWTYLADGPRHRQTKPAGL